MTNEERKVIELALEALENSVDLVVEDAYNAEQLYGNYPTRQGKVNGLKVLADQHKEAITAIKEALAQPEPKYRRGNRLICLETEEYCVIHISGTDRQWVKFPDSHIGVYTNEQVAELFELLPKEAEQDQDEVDIRSRLYQRIHELETQLAQPEQEPVAVKHMMEWVDYLKRKSDYGQHLQIPSEMSAGACWDLARELEQFITTPPQPKEPEQEPVASYTIDYGLLDCVDNHLYKPLQGIKE